MSEIPACEHCGRRRMMMVAMRAGKDGREWFLCPGCYEDGLRKLTGELIVPVARPPEQTVERSAAKADVGSFEREPNAERRSRLAYTGGIQYVPDEDGYW